MSWAPLLSRASARVRNSTAEEVEECDIEIEKIFTAEALKALETIKLWEMQQEDGQATTLQALDLEGCSWLDTREESKRR
jgi:hypothetical protein